MKDFNFEDTRAHNYHWEFNVDRRVVSEYISQIIAWTRLCLLEDTGDGFSGIEYWQKHVLLFDALAEDWSAEATIGFDGQDLFDVLATKCDVDPQSEAFQKAYGCVWRMLTRSSMQKVTHGKDLTATLHLGTLWD